MKQICIMFGNCALSGVRDFLKYSTFYDKYEFHQYFNWELIQSDELKIPIQIIKQADLVIYQPLSDVEGCYSTNKSNPNSFFNLLKPDCITISLPRIHNNALFPIFFKKRNAIDIYGKINNTVNSIEEVVYLYDNNKIDFDFENRLKRNYEISLSKETDCDIKIADFIYNNIGKQKLFLTHDHPSTVTINEITKHLCDILDIEYDFTTVSNLGENIIGYEDSVYHRKNNQYPISRYAIDHYNFEYIKTEDADADSFYRKMTVLSYIYSQPLTNTSVEIANKVRNSVLFESYANK